MVRVVLRLDPREWGYPPPREEPNPELRAAAKEEGGEKDEAPAPGMRIPPPAPLLLLPFELQPLPRELERPTEPRLVSDPLPARFNSSSSSS